MSAKPNPVPAGYHTVTPSLTIRGASKAIEFYIRAFNATESFRMETPEGKVMHAEIRIGDSTVMLSDEVPEWGALSPEAIGGCPALLRLTVPDCDALFDQAIAAGAKVILPVDNRFWGDRSGMVSDPFGYRWTIASRVEDVPADELHRRAAEMMSKKRQSA